MVIDPEDAPEPEAEPELFSYERPESDAPKVFDRFVSSDVIDAKVQVVREDGANNMHSHTGKEGFWFVLAGRARFYTRSEGDDDDEVLAELGQFEGILIPRAYPYWFESAGEEELEILEVAGQYETREEERVNYTEDWRESL